MPKVIIGSVEYEGDLDSFAKLEAAWPHMAAAQHAAANNGQVAPDQNPFTQMLPMLEVLAVSIDKPLPFVKGAIKFKTELPGILTYFKDLLTEAQVTRPGEPTPPATVPAANPSTATSTQS